MNNILALCEIDRAEFDAIIPGLRETRPSTQEWLWNRIETLSTARAVCQQPAVQASVVNRLIVAGLNPDGSFFHIYPQRYRDTILPIQQWRDTKEGTILCRDYLDCHIGSENTVPPCHPLEVGRRVYHGRHARIKACCKHDLKSRPHTGWGPR